MYKIVPNLRNAQCLSTLNRWELRTDGNEFIGCFAREEVAKEVKEALEKYHQKQVKEINFFSWYNQDREEKVFSFNGESAAFVWIPPGMFAMGDEESFQQLITFNEGFWMQTTPVTQGQWFAIMGHNPSHFIEQGSQCPVEKVSWADAKNFISQLASLGNFRLPTEAEWEYACRAGTTTRYHFGDDPDLLHKYAWYDKNAGGTTHPVGQLAPNSWGLYDMHGNVWEWCEDNWHEKKDSFVVRGGGVFSSAEYCTVNYRKWRLEGVKYPDVGFRLVFTE